ncbi:hypothetical protein KORDIASMS9_03126 [Kordia sp. SMS9]|uniref:hypothetical protein n=1 Tax=Kordia sp. SMS9 TaxID=2282170 RepID=UPI000E0DFD57|nr:hypothetical protein [Kordia sp. SMS9]AXG70876.1 hypothetical protein KORDIASMS9_03126 [Kordia sp. SMS9]
MKPTLTLYQKIQFFFDKAKIPTAYVLFLYITIIQYIPKDLISKEFKEISLLPAAITLGIIVLRIFFDIYKKVNQPQRNLPFFESWNALVESKEFSSSFEKRIFDDKVINLKVIGVSLRFYWPFIKKIIEKFLQEDKKFEFNLTLAILDPDFYEEAVFVDQNFRDKFFMQVKATIQDIEFFKKAYSGAKNCKCNIELIRYKFLTPFYGVSFDDKFLFLGNTHWRDSIFKSAGNSYNMYVEDDEFSGSEKIKMFNSWFDYIRSNQLLIE